MARGSSRRTTLSSAAVIAGGGITFSAPAAIVFAAPSQARVQLDLGGPTSLFVGRDRRGGFAGDGLLNPVFANPRQTPILGVSAAGIGS